MLRGKELDNAIEHELQIMLVEGCEKSPISHKSLYDRLIAKGYLSGGLSTLSTTTRKNLIARYMSEQFSSFNMKNKEKQLFINKKTRKALIYTNKNLRSQISDLEFMLNQNTQTLIKLIKAIKENTNLNIDHLLAPHLLKNYFLDK